jgi:hypothetical protein
MADQTRYCLGCTDPLLLCDVDANGTKNTTCKRCIAMDNHDFDVEPGARFNRQGERVDQLPVAKKRFVVLDCGKVRTDVIILPEDEIMKLIGVAQLLGGKDQAELLNGLVQKGRELMAELA